MQTKLCSLRGVASSSDRFSTHAERLGHWSCVFYLSKRRLTVSYYIRKSWLEIRWDLIPFFCEILFLSFRVCSFLKKWFKNAKLSDTFDVSINRFNVKAGLSRDHWIEKGWIFKQDPLGWFQWYCRFSMGRRIPEVDVTQIKRWKNFRRHVTAIEKNCEEGNLTCRKRQRQAILQWAYNPFI